MNTKNVYEILVEVDKVSSYEFAENYIREKELFPGSGFKGVEKNNNQWIIYTVSERHTMEDRKTIQTFHTQKEALKVFLIQKLRNIIAVQYRTELYEKHSVNLPHFNINNLKEVLADIPNNYYCYAPQKKDESYQLIEKENTFSYQYIMSDGSELGHNNGLFELPSWQVLSAFFTAVYVLYMTKKILSKQIQVNFKESDYLLPTIW